MGRDNCQMEYLAELFRGQTRPVKQVLSTGGYGFDRLANDFGLGVI
jgi:hypothetical protein